VSPAGKNLYPTNKGGMHPPLVNPPRRCDVTAYRHHSSTANIGWLQAFNRGFEIFAMRCAFFWVCLLLAGCAAVPQKTLPPGPIGAAFYLSGRVSVKHGTEAASGRISWQHEPDSDDLLLSNPFGQGVARIVRRDGLVTLTTSDQKVYQARDVGDLTEQVLGWRLPLAGLPDWVRGRAAAGVPAQTRLDSAHRVAELRQSGWVVEFLGYDNASGLPSRLSLSRDDTQIRMVIDQWRAVP